MGGFLLGHFRFTQDAFNTTRAWKRAYLLLFQTCPDRQTTNVLSPSPAVASASNSLLVWRTTCFTDSGNSVP